MRAAPHGGVPFMALDLRPGFSDRRSASIAPTHDSLHAAPLPEFRGADAPPRQGPGQMPDEDGVLCIESEADAYTTNWYDACWRVLFKNPPQGDAARRERIRKLRADSLLGPTGHVERMCAWTHVFGAVLFLGWALVRPATSLDSNSAAGLLSSYSSAVIAMVFLVSTGFHTLGTVRMLAPMMRMFDHGAIDIGLAVASVTDMAIVTLDFKDVPWQTIVDAVGVAVVIMLFFLYRRLVLKREDTEIAWGSCRLGLFRLQHADFEYSALRSASYIVLSFGFVALVPSALKNLSTWASTMLILANGSALLLLIAGLLLDNVLVWPDVLYQEAALKRKKPPWACHNKGCGCVMTSHAWWHVFTLVAITIQTVGRELAIADTQFHTHP